MVRKVYDFTQVGYSEYIKKLIEQRVKEVDKFTLMEDVTYINIARLVKSKVIADTGRVLGVYCGDYQESMKILCSYYEARGEYDGDSEIYPMIQMMYSVEQLTEHALKTDVFLKMPDFDRQAIELAMLSCLGSRFHLDELFEVLDGSDEYLIDDINSALDGVYILAHENKWEVLKDNTNKINSIIIRFFEGIRFDIDESEDDEI